MSDLEPIDRDDLLQEIQELLSDPVRDESQLDGDVALEPGDRVIVHGPPIVVPYGESHSERRTATVTRAGPLRAFWARHVAQWDLTSLYEVGFDGEPA